MSVGVSNLRSRHPQGRFGFGPVGPAQVHGYAGVLLARETEPSLARGSQQPARRAAVLRQVLRRPSGRLSCAQALFPAGGGQQWPNPDVASEPVPHDTRRNHRPRTGQARCREACRVGESGLRDGVQVVRGDRRSVARTVRAHDSRPRNGCLRLRRRGPDRTAAGNPLSWLEGSPNYVRPIRRAATPRWSDGEMPKEKINHAPQYIEQDPASDAPQEGVFVGAGEIGNIAWTPVPGGDLPGAWVPDTPIKRDAELAVGWHRDSWVQLSIEGDPDYFKMAADCADGDEGRTSVYTPPLSRDEVNKLIRALRRARDQVFGRDE